MFDYMKCIKTGCDVLVNNEFVLHGDLMWLSPNLLILSGVPKLDNYTTNDNGVKLYYNFKVQDAFEILGTGRDCCCFVLRHVYDVQDDFMNQLCEWESESVVNFFQKHL